MGSNPIELTKVSRAVKPMILPMGTAALPLRLSGSNPAGLTKVSPTQSE